MVTTLEVVVSPEDDAEIRRVTLKNTGILARDIEVTSYAEIVLATPAADLAHPAFSNLFVQTEFVPEVSGLVATRRPRSPEDPSLWAGHVVVVDGRTEGELQYESSRARFLGRGRTVRDAAMRHRRKAFVEHGGGGPGSRGEPAPPGASGARRDRAGDLHDDDGVLAGRGPGAGRQIP